MNINKNIINSFEKIIDLKISNDTNKLKKKKKNLEKVINKINKNSITKINHMYGGSNPPMSEEEKGKYMEQIRTKMESLQALVNSLSGIEIKASDENIGKIKESIKTILDKTSSILTKGNEIKCEGEGDEKKCSYNSTIQDSQLMNIMDKLSVYLNTSNAMIEINKLRGTIPIPTPPQLDKSKDNKSISTVINEIKKNIETQKNKISTEVDPSVFIKDNDTIITKIKEGNERINKLIRNYNQLITKFDNIKSMTISTVNFKTIKKNKFDGEYTDKINNNILVTEINKDTYKSLSSLFITQLDNSSQSNFENDIYEINQKLGIQSKNQSGNITLNNKKLISNIYNPNIELLIEQVGGMEPLEPSEQSQPPKPINDLFNKLNESFISLENKYKNEYLPKYTELSIKHNDYIHYIGYIMLLLSSQIVNTDYYITYKYINEGLIIFYQDILKEIIKKIENNSVDSITLFMKQNYKKIIYELYHFFSIAIKLNLGTEKLIDIKESDDKIKFYFSIFDHFKKVLDEYKRLTLSKLTVYGRINDYDKKNNLLPEKCNRVFLSDNMIKIEKTDKFNNSEKPQKCNLPNTSDDKINFKKLTVNAKICNSDMKNYAINFNQIFDSITYEDMNILTSYMGISSKLSSGEGTAIMTYGYSGTGKTFTLFGKKEKITDSNGSVSIKRTEGVLQAILKDIKEIKGLKLRLFELYGKGIPLREYWVAESKGSKDPSTLSTGKKSDCTRKSSDTKNIFKQIRTFNFKLAGDEFLLKNPEQYIIEGDDNITTFTNYDSSKKKKPKFKIKTITVNDDGTDIEITKNSKSVDLSNEDGCFITFNDYRKNIENISELTEKIDNLRKLTRTIRETPNNPESSRSIMIYDFILDFGNKKTVPFIIIDLPGREEIVESFADTFLKKSLSEKAISELIQDLPGKQSLNYAITSKQETLYHIPTKQEELNIEYNRKKSAKMALELAIKSICINPFILPTLFIDHLYEEQGKIFYPIKDQITEFIINTGNKQIFTIIFSIIFNDDLTKKITSSGISLKKLLEKKKDISFPFDNIQIGTYSNSGNVITVSDWYGDISNFKQEDEIFKVQKTVKNKAYKYDFQYFSGLCIALFKFLIINSEFEMLECIFENIMYHLINKKIKEIIGNMTGSELENEFVLYFGKDVKLPSDTDNIVIDLLETKYLDDSKVNVNVDNSNLNTNLKKVLYNKAKFNYFSTPNEGVFINENISGLIYYLQKNLLPKDKTFKQPDEPIKIKSLDHIKDIRKFAYLKNENTTIDLKKYNTDKMVNYSLYTKIGQAQDVDIAKIIENNKGLLNEHESKLNELNAQLLNNTDKLQEKISEKNKLDEEILENSKIIETNEKSKELYTEIKKFLTPGGGLEKSISINFADIDSGLNKKDTFKNITSLVKFFNDNQEIKNKIIPPGKKITQRWSGSKPITEDKIKEWCDKKIKEIEAELSPLKEALLKQTTKIKEISDNISQIQETITKLETNIKDIYSKVNKELADSLSGTSETKSQSSEKDFYVTLRPIIDEESIKSILESDVFINYYKSNVLHNKNTIAEKILCPYLNKINDYKIFYLFSNYNQELKCEHQIKLLDNTKDFIKSIVPDDEEN